MLYAPDYVYGLPAVNFFNSPFECFTLCAILYREFIQSASAAKVQMKGKHHD